MEITNQNTEKFRLLVKEYGLTLVQVSEISQRSYQRVKDWHSGKYHTVPNSMLELLELKLKDLRVRGIL